nr:hypothetical protein [uncultured Campylobacter sp.]
MIKRLKKYTHYERQKGVEKMLNKMDEKIKLWVLRANACDSFKNNDAFDALFGDFCKNALADELKSLEECEKKGKIATNEVLEKNLKYLSLVMGLNNDEKKILEFLICLKSISVLNDIFRDCIVNSFSCFSKIAMILALSKDCVKAALSYRSKLVKSGIIKPYKDCSNFDLAEAFDFGFEHFAFIMFENSSLEDMTNESIRQIDCARSKTTTNIDEILALIAKKPNANILLKDKEICKQVANRLGSRLYELVYSSNRFYSRLDAVFIANALLDSKNSILMIDEIDDIFNEKTPKALIKRILSENALPTFWLSDECEFSKYFDMVVG